MMWVVLVTWVYAFLTAGQMINLRFVYVTEHNILTSKKKNQNKTIVSKGLRVMSNGIYSLF